MPSFCERLRLASETNRSLLCVGLDPDPRMMPFDDVARFNAEIVDATRDLVCAYKPNIAFYEALGLLGLRALEQTIDHIRKAAPSALVVIDCKRGDIDFSSARYAEAMFCRWGADAVTVNPYLGGDSVKPFLQYEGKGVFILCRTSNAGAAEFQDLMVTINGKSKLVYQAVAENALSWGEPGQVGFVVGATYPRELQSVRSIVGDAPILLPGVGAQEGSLSESMRVGVDSEGRGLIVSASRSVLYASGASQFPDGARRAAHALRGEINATLEDMGRPWR